MSNVVTVRRLPDGRVRIHWFQVREDGPAVTPAGAVLTGAGVIQLGGVRGRIACQPELKDVTPRVKEGSVWPCVHSDDVRAATCPECLATPEARAALKELGDSVEV